MSPRVKATKPTRTVQVAAMVPAELADALKGIAARHERSVAAEIRVALRTWVAEADDRDKAAA